MLTIIVKIHTFKACLVVFRSHSFDLYRCLHTHDMFSRFKNVCKQRETRMKQSERLAVPYRSIQLNPLYQTL